MPESSKVLTDTFLKAITEVSDSQSAILELLSVALPNLTENERGFIKRQSEKAAARTQLFKAMLSPDEKSD